MQLFWLNSLNTILERAKHDDVIKWKHFPRYWPFVRGIHRSPVNSPHKGQWRGPLMFCLICTWINGWVNNRGAGDLRRHRAHYDVTVMLDNRLLWNCRQIIVPGHIPDDKSTLVQVTAWSRRATSHYLIRCWPNFMSPYGITGPRL